MSAVDQVHELWSLYASGGAFAILSRLRDDCEWVLPDDLAAAGPIRGAAEIRAFLERLHRDGVRVEPALHTCEAVTDDTVLVGGRMRIVSHATLLDSPQYWLYRMREGRIARIESYACRDEALTAA